MTDLTSPTPTPESTPSTAPEPAPTTAPSIEPNPNPTVPHHKRPFVTTLAIAILVVVLVATGIIGYEMGKRSSSSQILPVPTPTENPSATLTPTTTPTSEIPDGVACTMEAKLCPDGSYVGRQGPNCEFAACPGEETTSSTDSLPEGWVRKNFPQAQLSLAYPKNWQSSFTEFPENPSQLIRLWQGANESSTTIHLQIQSNWDNIGIGNQSTTFQISENITATKVDPPAMDEEKLDRYQTNYYFTYADQVYVLECVHNWIPEQYQLCQTLLKTIRFTN